MPSRRKPVAAAKQHSIGRWPMVFLRDLCAPRLAVISGLAVLFTLSYLLAALVRFDFTPGPDWQSALSLLWSVVAIQSLVFFLHGAHRGWMAYASLRDLWLIARASLVSLVAVVTLRAFVSHLEGVSRTILLLDFVLSFMAVAGARFGSRLFHEIFYPGIVTRAKGPRAVIVGAGDTTDCFLREIQRSSAIQLSVVGLIDDDPRKHGSHIHGVPVVGCVDQLAELVEREGIEEVIIATPSASGREMRRIVDACRAAGVPFRTLPAIEDLVYGKVSVSELREVRIEDLLRRDAVELDHVSIAEYLAGSCVLVTGAAGSIGSEICRQVARFNPSQILLVERAENALFELERELYAAFPNIPMRGILADVADRVRMDSIFAQCSPTVVFHAAAHKHVPLVEANPGEAVKNNIFGTKVVADLADQHGVATFVMISTDKAVNPTSIMGATKRVCEVYLQALARRSKTRYVAVRFGNVLGSNGSVVPIFKEQIRKGGPITITHPEMRRYFMTIPEASQLVLQAAALGKGGEVFVLDMGEQIKIVDLARDLIRLSGLDEEDIEIKFTGSRPGEKLYEELALDGECATKTRHPKIWIGRVAEMPMDKVLSEFGRLSSVAASGSAAEVALALRQLVPELRRDIVRPLTSVPTISPVERIVVS